MRIDEEKYKIAAANYGVDLKEPIFVAFDKFLSEGRFELLHDIINNDYKEIEDNLYDYLNSQTTSEILRCIMNLFVIFNGRKGFYAKRFVGHKPDPDDNLSIWMEMLSNELRNSGNGSADYGVAVRGSGEVDGPKIRAAIYHIFDILSYGNSICVEAPIYTATSPCCVVGRDIYDLLVTANEDNVGYLNTINNKYYVDVEITDLYKGEDTKITISILIGDEPLKKNQSIGYSFPENYKLPYSLYDVRVKDFDADLRISYFITRRQVTPVTDDYVYERYGPSDIFIKILSYTGSDKEVVIPSSFTHDYDIVTTIGIDTFSESDVEKVIIPEGVTTIE